VSLVFSNRRSYSLICLEYDVTSMWTLLLETFARIDHPELWSSRRVLIPSIDFDLCNGE
jgi:hypothetical protein